MDQTLLTPIIVAVIPIVVMLAKKFIPERYTVLLPVLATVLGPAADWLSTLATGASANPVRGLLMGGAAVALREIIDQTKKTIAPPSA